MSKRRELLNLGLPELSTRAFVVHGRSIKPQDGGGGSSQPETTTQNVNSVPEFIRPYVENMLGRTQALTQDAQYEPYNPNQRFEGASPLQQLSYNTVGGMQTAPQVGAATDVAGNAITQAGQAGVDGSGLMNTALGFGQGAVNAGGSFNTQATDPNAVGQFMSPYAQNVIDVNKAQAIRDFENQQPMLTSAATRAGALGGSRHAILEAEGYRNLNQNLSNIQDTGMQSAYDRAIQAMQFGNQAQLQGFQTGLQGVGQGINAAQLGLQGANTMLQGAGTLGQLGQTQFNQQMGIADAQNAMGTQQQQMGQQQRDFNYQQYLDELNFPYKQLGFMSDMTRGLPLSQNSQVYSTPGPNLGSQLLGAGLGAYGMINRAEGGIVPAPTMHYASGGLADITDVQFVREQSFAEGGQVSGSAFDALDMNQTTARLRGLSDQQLAQYAGSVSDAVTLGLIQAEMARRQTMRAPQGQIPQSTVSQDVAQQGAQAGLGAVAPQQIPAMHGGGLVAFAEGGRAQGHDFGPLRDFFGRMKTDVAQVFPEGALAGQGLIEDLPPEEREARERLQRLGLEAPPARVPQGPTPSSAVFPVTSPDLEGQTGFDLGKWIRDHTTGGQMYDLFTKGRPDAPPEASAPTVADLSGLPSEDPLGSGLDLSQTPPAPPAPQGAPGAPVGLAGVRPSGGGGGGASAESDFAKTLNVPDSFASYVNDLDKQSGQSEEDKVALQAMRAGLDERQAKAAGMEHRNKMDALVAAGAAMMQGRSLGEGLALGAAAGTKTFMQAQDKQDAMLEKIADAQDAQRRYELSLRKDDKKLTADLRRNYDRTVNDAQTLMTKYKLGLAELAVKREGNAIQAARVGALNKMDDLATRQLAVDKMLNSNPIYKEAAKKLNSLIPEEQKSAAATIETLTRLAMERYKLPYNTASASTGVVIPGASVRQLSK